MARTHTDRILFGAAYYDEYMPKDLDRVDEDMRMMKEAGINLIRIAESTWSTEEPQPGVFDFTHIDRALDAAQRAGIDVIVGTPTYAVPTWMVKSTWSTEEPQPGVFDFTHIDRALDAAQRAGIDVIVGTPTYAVPTWMVKMHPEVLAVTPAGPGKYGARQIMDIVNPTYRFYAERIIRKLISHVADHPAVIGYQVDNETKYYDSARQIMDIVNPTYRFYAERIIRKLISHVADHPAVIGYQVDNETKYYDSVSPDMQALFVKYLREKFNDDLDELNARFGLDYWSNRINAWEDFPDVTATINQSLLGEFDRFRRAQVAEFLKWQADIVREYAKPDQFITHNFDFEWRGYSFGVQPAVDHFKAAQGVDITGVDIDIVREYAKPDQFITHNFDFEWRGYSFGVQPAVDHFKAAQGVDITGVDIYHPTEDDLTGKEIAFGGDMTRSTKDGANYLVLETEAQGQHGWLPFPGQLRLQAYSHLASGADCVEYWHWHSIHNSWESYWKGLLSHDLEPNPTYREAGVFGNEIADPKVGERLVHLKKRNKVAIMVSNESLSALDWFLIEAGFPFGGSLKYNDVVRNVYDALFELNVECDFVPVDAPAERLAKYEMIVAPALYCTPQETTDNLRGFVANGGHLVATMRSFVTDDRPPTTCAGSSPTVATWWPRCARSSPTTR